MTPLSGRFAPVLKIAAGTFFLLGTFFWAVSTARGAVPVLMLSSVTGDLVQVTVNGDPNSSVNLYYNVGSPAGMQVRTLGATGPGGYFTAQVSTATYGINPGGTVYVVVNGQQSPLTAWPYAGGAGTLSLSQNNLVLGMGQSAIVYVSGGSGLVQLLSNSNPSAANFSVSGAQITVTANNPGSAAATFCDRNNSSNCVLLFETTQSAATQNIAFGQSSAYLAAGQSTGVSISGGGGNYYLSVNSNPSLVQASISGATLFLVANNLSGSSNITVCASGTNYCGTLPVTVQAGTGALSFSQNNVFIPAGGSQNVTIYGSGNYSISSVSVPGIVSAAINGNTLSLFALSGTGGSANVAVCQQNGVCGVVVVTVAGTGGGQISFSQTSPILAPNQSLSVLVSGGSGSYYVSSANTNILQASVSGSILNLYGLNPGSGGVTVCSGSVCGTLYVTVSGPAAFDISDQRALLQAQIQTLQFQLAQLQARQGGALYLGPTAPYGYYSFGFLARGSSGSQVYALQQRLSAEGVYNGPITGYYGPLTQAAVRGYQSLRGLYPSGAVDQATQAALNGW